MAKLLLLFTIVPLVELFLLLKLAQVISAPYTVLIVFVTGAVGAWFGKREGLKVYDKWKAALAQGTMPEEGIIGGLLVLVGVVLLVTPGVLTDFTGLSLLFPPTRKIIAKQVKKIVDRKLAEGSLGFFSSTFGEPEDSPFDVKDVESEGWTTVESERTPDTDVVEVTEADRQLLP